MPLRFVVGGCLTFNVKHRHCSIVFVPLPCFAVSKLQRGNHLTHLKLTLFCRVGDEADDKDKVPPGGDVDDDDDPENRYV